MMRIGRRVSATFVVSLILLSAQASQVLHELVVRHETCPVNGEIVEGNGHAVDADALPSRAAHPRARLLAAGDGELHAHAHDRCLASLGDSDAVTSDVAALARALPLDAALLAAPTPSAGHRSLPLFRLAPKNSPPV